MIDNIKEFDRARNNFNKDLYCCYGLQVATEELGITAIKHDGSIVVRVIADNAPEGITLPKVVDEEGEIRPASIIKMRLYNCPYCPRSRGSRPY